jgi:hypothetical protein
MSKFTNLSDDGVSGFMCKGSVGNFHHFKNTSTGKIGIVYCKSVGELIHIQGEDIIWNNDKTKFTTKREIKGLSVKDNVVTVR